MNFENNHLPALDDKWDWGWACLRDSCYRSVGCPAVHQTSLSPYWSCHWAHSWRRNGSWGGHGEQTNRNQVQTGLNYFRGTTPSHWFRYVDDAWVKTREVLHLIMRIFNQVKRVQPLGSINLISRRHTCTFWYCITGHFDQVVKDQPNY